MMCSSLQKLFSEYIFYKSCFLKMQMNQKMTSTIAFQKFLRIFFYNHNSEIKLTAEIEFKFSNSILIKKLFKNHFLTFVNVYGLALAFVKNFQSPKAQTHKVVFGRVPKALRYELIAGSSVVASCNFSFCEQHHNTWMQIALKSVDPVACAIVTLLCSQQRMSLKSGT